MSATLSQIYQHPLLTEESLEILFSAHKKIDFEKSQGIITAQKENNKTTDKRL